MAIAKRPQSHQAEVESFIAGGSAAKDDKRLAAIVRFPPGGRQPERRISASGRWSTSAHQEHNCMAMSLSEAAAATGVNRSTLFRAYKSGRMSATRTDTGQIEVDPAELFRVFPLVEAQGPEISAMHQHAQGDDAHGNALRTNALEVEVKMLREMLDAMREDRNAWREQAAKVTAALPAPEPRRSWWRRLVG
jgi:hypothetical protein